ncbi:hypothetical protein CXF77_08500 [Planococcus sp. MB-3u-09]|nr:hypothetical protein CXF66_13385 [Planococcus sp. Urea-trap-24]PKG87164.1 hypothetical protein CXF91_14225 [Planococcus sp. Urea-3u-39]PKH40268.1 hypothetical protein CXF77_08500 [Planococcus sp. MB-3u-09]
MKYLILVIIIALLWVLGPVIGINSIVFFPNAIAWITKFILPWIALYWLIRLVKVQEKNRGIS